MIVGIIFLAMRGDRDAMSRPSLDRSLLHPSGISQLDETQEPASIGIIPAASGTLRAHWRSEVSKAGYI